MQTKPLASAVTLTASEAKSAQFQIAPYNQHDVHLSYIPVDITHWAVQLEIRIYVSDDPQATALADSTWRPVGTYVDLSANGTLTFNKTVVRARALAANSADRNQVYSFPVAAKKMYVSYLEAGSPSGFGTVSLIMNSNMS